MTAIESSARARRGRILTVGQSPLIAALTDRLTVPPVRAANLYDAIGEVTLASAADPIVCVVMSADVLRDSPSTVVNAFRRVDPSVRLILLCGAANDPSAEAALRAGFDECIGAPFTEQQLRRALDVPIKTGSSPAASLAPQAPTAPTIQTPASAPTQQSAAAAPREWQSLPPPRSAPRVESDPAPPPPPARPVPVPSSQAAPAHLPQPAAAQPVVHQPRADLGDTDLVETILSRSAPLVDRALQLIVQQTGWSDLALVPTADETDRAGGAIVAFAGRTFGQLRASGAPSAQLQSWADWLARWLALDRVHRECRSMAYRDDLTGAGNRRFFNLFLARAIKRGYENRRPVTVMVFDIDDFKIYNDRFGHDAGDEILCETVRLLNSVIRRGDRVFRIGGDEFVVVFADPEAPREPGSHHPESAEQIAARFQDRISSMQFPKLSQEALGPLSISAGLATYPWDGQDAQTLLSRADQRALQSKRRGKNAITFGPTPPDAPPPLSDQR